MELRICWASACITNNLPIVKGNRTGAGSKCKESIDYKTTRATRATYSVVTSYNTTNASPARRAPSIKHDNSITFIQRKESLVR